MEQIINAIIESTIDNIRRNAMTTLHYTLGDTLDSVFRSRQSEKEQLYLKTSVMRPFYELSIRAC